MSRTSWPRLAMVAALSAVTSLSALTCLNGEAHAQVFTFLPAGDLVSDSGDGRMDDTNYAPGMRFPMESGPAFANSQVYNPGGFLGPPGGQCDAFNYNYPWRDNYCETRQWDMPLCPAGQGHQGQDIRPGSCEKEVHWAVAAANGTITNIGSYSVYLTAEDGTRYDYLHMGGVQVSVGDSVVRGQRLGLVSNEFGGSSTTIHLHYNIRKYIDNVGTVYVPTYMALVSSYQDLIGNNTSGTLEQVDCDHLRGWAADLSQYGQPVDITLGLEMAAGELLTTFRADVYRSDLCENLSYCNHGFEVPAPLGLFDGKPHPITAYAGEDGMAPALGGSPQVLQCEPWELSGIKRPISDSAITAWALVAVWDELPAPKAAVDALDKTADWSSAPELITNDEQDRHWLLDEGRLRLIPNAATARAWRLDLESAEVTDQQTRANYGGGPDLLPRPVLLRDSEDQLYLLDRLAEDDNLGVIPSAGVGSSGSGFNTLGGIPNSPRDTSDCGCRLVAPHRASPIAPWASLLWLLAAVGLASRRTTNRGKSN